MRLIVGLGNPGPEYNQTRHNAGFMVLDRLAQRHHLLADQRPKLRFHAAAIEGTISGQRCLLLEPQTYMNRSGLCVQEAAAFYKIPAQELLVVVDDVALPAGKLRLRAGGSPGGHNGLADIERALGTAEYPRLRVGVDAPGRVPQADYVLSRFTPDQMAQVTPALETACDVIECWLGEGIATAMNRFNGGEAQE
ncbi:MAG: aminoacyl-tRNA hydrolase [Phycisphaeraceae bacterium]|nr:aminoacyl-tRNA hydrolase [Phycisphaeraceae bacterium]